MKTTKAMKIKRGTALMQDYSFFAWPGPYEDKVDTIFQAEIEGNRVIYRAHGFGILGRPSEEGAYGNGALFGYIDTEEK